ncbi:DUF5324 family protein [Streptacidiphilus sp. ASG 303]|uniref:DUF5324 family protein n=1 Tax=Streptacidiphilus sp. ASG 303 TaxID=2896847 RepID=UPI001E3FB855|nr:DUF5324 family protein [Streptacidiphilus sp. ASG 303]MCD0482220.1 DUF5324 family protein [Streptacidiphilus sp. ASG 303]
MTRLDAARDAAGRTRDTLAPYAATAKDTAAHYAEEARQRLAPRIEALAPKVEAAAAQAAAQARDAAVSTYVQHVAPRVEQARAGVPPQLEDAAVRAGRMTRETAATARDAAVAAGRQARATAVPAVAGVVGEARIAAAPVAREAQTRGAAALAALRGQVTAAEIEKLARKHARRERRGRAVRRLFLLGLLAGGGVAAWKWWRRQNSPEWLVEPPLEAEVSGDGALAADQVRAVSPTGKAAAEAATRDNIAEAAARGDALDGAAPLDPEVQAKEDESRDGHPGS